MDLSPTTQLMLEKLKKTDRRGKPTAEFKLVATSLLELHEEVRHLSTETLGNGIPGGLKLQVHDLKAQVHQILERIEEIRSDLKPVIEQSSHSYGRRKTDLLNNTNDPFKKFVAWLTDRILPPLLIALLLWFGQVFFFGAVVLFLFTTGILHF